MVRSGCHRLPVRNGTDPRCSSLAELDAMAGAAGLVLSARWHDWVGGPPRSDSTDPFRVYCRAR